MTDVAIIQKSKPMFRPLITPLSSSHNFAFSVFLSVQVLKAVNREVGKDFLVGGSVGKMIPFN